MAVVEEMEEVVIQVEVVDKEAVVVEVVFILFAKSVTKLAILPTSVTRALIRMCLLLGKGNLKETIQTDRNKAFADALLLDGR